MVFLHYIHFHRALPAKQATSQPVTPQIYPLFPSNCGTRVRAHPQMTQMGRCRKNNLRKSACLRATHRQAQSADHHPRDQGRLRVQPDSGISRLSVPRPARHRSHPPTPRRLQDGQGRDRLLRRRSRQHELGRINPFGFPQRNGRRRLNHSPVSCLSQASESALRISPVLQSSPRRSRLWTLRADIAKAPKKEARRGNQKTRRASQPIQ